MSLNTVLCKSIFCAKSIYMKDLNLLISHFHIIRPKYESSQKQTLEWLAKAHVKAESVKRNNSIDSEEMRLFAGDLRKRLNHVGCKPGMIDKRGHSISDFLHDRWHEMDLYNIEDSPRGVDLGKRGAKHQSIVDEIIEQFYKDHSALPDYAVHVSCTGYASPSPLQKLVSGRKANTQLTHAYHMGCYASIPSMRIAGGALQLSGSQADIIHTELCCFHNNPLQHNPEHLVVQSLFADGFIKYSLHSNKTLAAPHYLLLGLYEEIIPASMDAMEWNITDWGFQMVLSKEIPRLIKDNIRQYVGNLCQRAHVEERDILQNGIFAIHPGGPKILQHIQTILGLEENQLEASKRVLRNCGNMSSATLPHIWADILADSKIPSGTKVLSLAFGPGLNIAGAIIEKRG